MTTRANKENESGMVVVEGVLTFTVFIMMVVAIIFLTNIFMVHNRIQFAINATAHELASYSYVYQALGARDASLGIQADGDPYTQPIDDTAAQIVDSLNKIQSLQSDSSELVNDISGLELSEESIARITEQYNAVTKDGKETLESAKQSVSMVKQLFSDSDSLIAGVIYMCASGADYAVKSAGATMAAKGLTKKYLVNGEQSADDYLKGYGITKGYAGLDFSGSTMFCDEKMKMIDIVVEYDVDLSFIGILTRGTTFHMVNRVTVPGWVDGDGVKVNG